ncbi:MAG TPA: hypothetical protein PLA94_16945 [Myxococcota bacterium]|nr:hypothetical protein [Myxococcota bacterium]
MHKFFYFTLLLISIYAGEQAVAKCAGLSARFWDLNFLSLTLIDGPPATTEEQLEEEARWQGNNGLTVFQGGTAVLIDFDFNRAEFHQP